MPVWAIMNLEILLDGGIPREDGFARRSGRWRRGPAPAEAWGERHGEECMKVRPLHDRVLVRRSADTEQRVGGIIIPDSAKEKPQQGTVIAAGHGEKTDAGKRVPLDITVGDRILFGTFSGQEVTLDGDPYLIMKIEEVLAVIEGPAEPRQAAINGRAVKVTKAKALPSKRTVKKRAEAQRRKKR